MKAIIIPGINDLNKGDQALVWESYRLVSDTNCFNEVYILSNGDTPEEKELLCSQSEKKGFQFVENILNHPRRGKHNIDEHIRESVVSLISQISNATWDFISRSILLTIAPNLILVKIFFSRKVYLSLKQFKNIDMFFVKGGGFIHAYGEKTAPYLMWYFLFYVRLAIRLKKKVVFLPNSFGPFEGLTVKRQVRSVLKKVDLIYAREELSSKKLGELLNKNIPISPDLGFYLEPSSKNSIENILTKYNIKKQDKIVGITIRPWRFSGTKNPEDLFKIYIKSIKELASHIVNKGYIVAFCNQSLGPNSHEDDRNAIKKMSDIIDDDKIIWIDENMPCDELKALYSKFTFFVGTRFHSVIFSITSSIPSIAIAYGGNKAKGIMTDFNLENYTIPIEDINPIKLIEMFDMAMINYESIKRELNKNLKSLDQKRSALINEINDLL